MGATIVQLLLLSYWCGKLSLVTHCFTKKNCSVGIDIMHEPIWARDVGQFLKRHVELGKLLPTVAVAVVVAVIVVVAVAVAEAEAVVVVVAVEGSEGQLPHVLLQIKETRSCVQEPALPKSWQLPCKIFKASSWSSTHNNAPESLMVAVVLAGEVCVVLAGEVCDVLLPGTGFDRGLIGAAGSGCGGCGGCVRVVAVCAAVGL